jgi:hypothetical protein
MKDESKEFLAALAVVTDIQIEAEQRIARAKEWSEEHRARQKQLKVEEELRTAQKPLTHRIRFFGRG